MWRESCGGRAPVAMRSTWRVRAESATPPPTPSESIVAWRSQRMPWIASKSKACWIDSSLKISHAALISINPASDRGLWKGNQTVNHTLRNSEGHYRYIRTSLDLACWMLRAEALIQVIKCMGDNAVNCHQGSLLSRWGNEFIPQFEPCIEHRNVPQERNFWAFKPFPNVNIHFSVESVDRKINN